MQTGKLPSSVRSEIFVAIIFPNFPKPRWGDICICRSCRSFELWGDASTKMSRLTALAKIALVAGAFGVTVSAAMKTLSAKAKIMEQPLGN
jgi:hypothetical protein